MLNDPPDKNDEDSDRNSSDHGTQVTLRIPSVSPIITGLLEMTLLVLFVMRSLAGSPDPAVLAMGLQGDAVFERWHIWRLVTSQLLLVLPAGRLWLLGLLQALFTLYTLYIVGNEMEKLWGNLRFGLVYMLGGAWGGLMTLLLIPTGFVSMDAFWVTTSSAVLATLGAQLVYMVKHRKLYGNRGVQRRNFLIGVAAINLLIGALVPQVDVIGLVGGLVGGVLLGFYISPYHLPRPHPEQPNALLGEDVNPLRSRIIPLMTYISLLVSGVILGIVYIG